MEGDWSGEKKILTSKTLHSRFIAGVNNVKQYLITPTSYPYPLTDPSSLHSIVHFSLLSIKLGWRCFHYLYSFWKGWSTTELSWLRVICVLEFLEMLKSETQINMHRAQPPLVTLEMYSYRNFKIPSPPPGPQRLSLSACRNFWKWLKYETQIT